MSTGSTWTSSAGTHASDSSASAIDVLAIGPHPDDVELFIGGTTRHLAQLGHRVVILDLTRGESATRGTPAIRAVEAARAAEVLGVARDQLGLPDGGVRGDDPEQAKALVTYLRTHRPELVMCPWTEERHPDHEAAAALVLRAVFLASAGGYLPELPRHVVREVLHYPMRVLTKPSFVVDISHVRAAKQQAIACHASQVGHGQPFAPSAGGHAGQVNQVGQSGQVDRLELLADMAPTLVGHAHASGLDAIAARDAFYGAQIGVAAAEPFIMRATLHLADPLAHLRTRPGPALLFEAR